MASFSYPFLRVMLATTLLTICTVNLQAGTPVGGLGLISRSHGNVATFWFCAKNLPANKKSQNFLSQKREGDQTLFLGAYCLKQ